MSAQIIDGKAFAAKVRGQVAEHVTRIKEENGITPGLALYWWGKTRKPSLCAFKGQTNRRSGHEFL